MYYYIFQLILTYYFYFLQYHFFIFLNLFIFFNYFNFIIGILNSLKNFDHLIANISSYFFHQLIMVRNLILILYIKNLCYEFIFESHIINFIIFLYKLIIFIFINANLNFLILFYL